MAEPAFYQCKSCSRTWQRTEWKTRRNPPATCPHCKSLDQVTDQAREDAYIREAYGPITQHIGQLISTALDKRDAQARPAVPPEAGAADEVTGTIMISIQWKRARTTAWLSQVIREHVDKLDGSVWGLGPGDEIQIHSPLPEYELVGTMRFEPAKPGSTK